MLMLQEIALSVIIWYVVPLLLFKAYFLRL